LIGSEKKTGCPLPVKKKLQSLYGLTMRIIRPGVRIIKRFTTFLAILFLTGLITASESSGQDQPTVISNVKVEPSPFSPNNDGINETTKFSLTLSEPSTVSVEIVFFSNLVEQEGIRLYNGVMTDTLFLGDEKIPFASDTIYYTTEGVAGLNEFTWDGVIRYNLTKEEIQLPDSTYTYLIRAEDKDTDDQFKSRPVTGTVTIDSRPPVISSVSVSPNPFSPNSDGLNDFARIRFTLNGLPQNATVGILAFRISLDINGNPFFELDNANTTDEFYTSDSLQVPFAPIPLQFIKRSLNKENISFSIRGRRVLASGDIVDVSTSTITISPGDPVGTTYPDPNGTLFSFIDQVEGVNGSPAENASNTVEVRTAAGAVRVDVRNSLNLIVASNLPLDPPFIGNGVYAASFGPGPFDDGVYTYLITAVDESGNQTQVTGTVTARSNPINIAGLQAAPDTISPADGNNKFDLSAISYNLQNRPGNVTLQIFRDSTVFVSNNLVRTLFSNTAQQEGPHTEIWDGRNDSGEYVSPGEERAYRVIVSAFDPQTFETTEARMVIFVDNLPPQALQLNPLPAQTQEASITLTGRSDPGDSVVVFLNGRALEPPALDPSSGFFEIQLDLQSVTNLVNAIAFDPVKNGPSYSDTLKVSFPLDITGRVGFFPADSSVVRGLLARVTALVADTDKLLFPGETAVMRITQRGLPVAGTSAISGDTLIFTFEDTLADDGSEDGLYEVFASMDITELGGRAEARAIFTVDNRAPDTARVEVEVSADEVAVVAEFTDGGVYPNVSGIDQGATEVVIEEPGGKLIEPATITWLDSNTLEASFGALQVAGLYYLRLTVSDRGGLTTILSKQVVSSFGPGQGRSVAFVDDVPARTQARIHFISGRGGKRITRAILRIFNLRGDLVRRLDVTGLIDPEGTSVSAEWLLENDSGSLVVNGVFIYYWEVTFNDGRTERIRKTLAVARR